MEPVPAKEKITSVNAMIDIVTHWPSAGARAWALEQIPNLCRSENVCAVVLFGSIVRDAAAASDLDVLYVYEGSPPNHPNPPIDVDLRKFERGEVEGLLNSGNDLLSWCIKFGLKVCERNQYWSVLVETWGNRLGLPSREVALERATKAEKLLRNIVSLGDNDAALEIYLTLLTHLARARLIHRGVYPASRPELPKQLGEIGEARLASYLKEALSERNAVVHGIRSSKKNLWQAFLDEIDLGSSKVRVT